MGWKSSAKHIGLVIIDFLKDLNEVDGHTPKLDNKIWNIISKMFRGYGFKRKAEVDLQEELSWKPPKQNPIHIIWYKLKIRWRHRWTKMS